MINQILIIWHAICFTILYPCPKGEKKKEQEDKDEHHHCVERYYGSFQRTFRVQANIKADKIDAAFDKGALQVTLPKTEAAKKKEIEIKVK